jgi:hypothetical protein
VIVGRARGDADYGRPFIWDDLHSIRDVNDVLRDDYGLGESLAGWTLTGALDISDDGRTIVGDGLTPQGILAPWIAHLGSPLGPTWNLDGTGNWSTAANWAGGKPNEGGLAVFGEAITAPRTVTVDAPITVGRVFFDNTHAYTFAGTNVLTLDSTGDVAEINVVTGSHTISAPITVSDNTLITVTPPTGNLTITQALNANGVTISKAGAGTLTLANLRASKLSISAGRVDLTANAASASVVETLAIAGDNNPTAQLDLGNTAIVVDHSVTSPAATVRQQIVAGRGGSGLDANWNGQGITSSAAATVNATDPESRSIGYAENGNLPLGPYTDFRGEAVDDTSLLIAFTRTGDANLDGVVNDDDVTIVGATYAPGVAQASWALGDFDYNGFVDDDDVTLLGAFYDPSTSGLAAVSTDEASLSASAIPEPSTIALSAVISAALAPMAISRRRLVE